VHLPSSPPGRVPGRCRAPDTRNPRPVFQARRASRSTCVKPSVATLDVDLGLLLLLDLQQQRTVDVREDTAKSNGGANESVEFLVTADGELQVARRDALDLEILGGVASQLEDFSGQVLQDGSDIDGG
jgi:hypothetical protein